MKIGKYTKILIKIVYCIFVRLIQTLIIEKEVSYEFGNNSLNRLHSGQGAGSLQKVP